MMQNAYEVIRRRKLIILVCILLGVGVAPLLSFIRNEGEYRATAKVVVSDEGEYNINEELNAANEIAKTFQKPPRVKQHENTLLIFANGKSQDDAIEHANQVADGYANQKRQAFAEKATSLKGQLEKQQQQLLNADERLKTFSKKKPSLSGSTTQQARSVDKHINRLRAQKNQLQKAMRNLSDKSVAPLEKLANLPANYRQFYNLKNIKQLDKLQSELISLRQKYTQKHIHVQNKLQEIDAIVALIEKEAKRAISAQISKINNDLKPLLDQQKALKSESNSSKPMSPEAYQQKREELKREKDTEDQKYADIEAELKKYQKWAETGNVSERSVEAKLPFTVVPAENALRAMVTLNWRTMLIGGALGLLVGLIVAVVFRRSGISDNKIASLEASLGTAILSVIPHIDFEASDHSGTPAAGESSSSYQDASEVEYLSIKARPSDNGKPDVSVDIVTSQQPAMSVAESFRVLRTNILFKERDKSAKSLLFTSAYEEEGKTTITSNLAVSIAQSGKRMLLVDGNLQNPQVHELFGLYPVPGLAELLLTSTAIDETVRSSTDIFFGNMELEELLKTPGLDNMHLLLVGKESSSHEKLLSTTELPRLLNELKKYYDIIIIDGSSISTGADALVWSARVDGVILIHRNARPKRSVIKRAKKTLEENNANLWGVVLNDTKVQRS